MECINDYPLPWYNNNRRSVSRVFMLPAKKSKYFGRIWDYFCEFLTLTEPIIADGASTHTGCCLETTDGRVQFECDGKHAPHSTVHYLVGIRVHIFLSPYSKYKQ